MSEIIQRKLQILVDEPETELDDEFLKISQNISEVITNSTPRFTIGITGKWGTGKTTMMKAIQKSLESYNDVSIPVVWFNAWRYEHEKTNATIPLLLTILNGFRKWLETNTTNNESKLEKIKKFGKGLSGSVTIGVEGMASGTLNFDPEKTNSSTDNAKIFQQRNIPTIQEGIELVESLKEDVTLNLPNKLKLVVFIDDLDRCSHHKALEVLESIKVMLGIDGIVYVVGISDNTISRLIDIQYKDTGIKGEDYLKKIIQVKYQLRTWTTKDIREIIEKNILKELGNNAPEFLTNNNKDKNYDMISQITEANPRELKRFLNNLILSFALVKKEGMDEEKLLIIEALKSRWEGFFLRYSNEHADLRRLLLESTRENMDELKKPITTKRKNGDTLSIDEKIVEEMTPELWDFFVNVKEKLESIMPDQWSLYLRATKSIENMNEHTGLDTSFDVEMWKLLRSSQIVEFNRIRPSLLYLQGAELQDAHLQRAHLQRASLAHANLEASDLRDVDLRMASLDDANLQGADLQRAYLQGSSLRLTDLRNTNLQHADLQGADLQGADLQGADLRDANLQHAYLRDTNLLNAVLSISKDEAGKRGAII